MHEIWYCEYCYSEHPREQKNVSRLKVHVKHMFSWDRARAVADSCMSYVHAADSCMSTCRRFPLSQLCTYVLQHLREQKNVSMLAVHVKHMFSWVGSG